MIVGRVAKLALIAALGLTSTACGDRGDAGPVRTDTREVGSFDSIELRGAARLEIAVGAPESLALEGEEAVISKVETDVRGHTLHINAKPKRWFISHGRACLQIRITAPRLASLTLEGGNDVRLTGFKGGATKIRMTGAAQIEADGQLEQLTVHMAGAGRADFSKLVSDRAKVTVDGVGSVIVNPRDTLDATMNGVGAILYTGSPRKVSTRMNGLGTIGQREMDQGEAAEDEVDDDEPVEADPGPLQPEYAEPARKKKNPDPMDVNPTQANPTQVDSTEVI